MGLFGKDINENLTSKDIERRNELHDIARQAIENNHVYKPFNKWIFTDKYTQEGLTYLNAIMSVERYIFYNILDTVREEITQEGIDDFIIESTLSEIPGYTIVETKGWDAFDFNINIYFNNIKERRRLLSERLANKHANAFINIRIIARSAGALSIYGEAVVLKKLPNVKDIINATEVVE